MKSYACMIFLVGCYHSSIIPLPATDTNYDITIREYKNAIIECNKETCSTVAKSICIRGYELIATDNEKLVVLECK
jgi:hypothetical protein